MKKEDFIQESEVLKEMDHPKLVRLLAVSTKEDPIYIVTELLENGSLKEYLEMRQKKNHLVEVPVMLYMAAQVCCWCSKPHMGTVECTQSQSSALHSNHNNVDSVRFG